MARPKQYDREQVIFNATQLFMKNGFEGTSTRDLVDVTKLNKRSMYTEFTDKEGLFIACLKEYIAQGKKRVLPSLLKKPYSLSNIVEFFRGHLEYASSDECLGCLVVNSSVEHELLSDKVNEIVTDHSQFVEQLFLKNIDGGKEREEISNSIDSKGAAKYLSYLMKGIIVSGKNHDIQRNSIETIINLITITFK